MTDMKQFQNAGKTKVVKGSVLNPENAGLCFVLNLANLAGKTDGAMYSVFNKKWSKVKQDVRGWFTTKTGSYKLGAVRTIAVQSNVWVFNLLCQDEEYKTDLVALAQSLKEVCKAAKYEKATVHVSQFLLKEIPELANLLNDHLVVNGVSVYYYTEE